MGGRKHRDIPLQGCRREFTSLPREFFAGGISRGFNLRNLNLISDISHAAIHRSFTTHALKNPLALRGLLF